LTLAYSKTDERVDDEIVAPAAMVSRARASWRLRH
jgi:hypothetical protein